MKTVSISKNKNLYEVPETWAEAEEMITKVLRQASGRGRNLELMGICTRIAYGLMCDRNMTADPSTALAYVIQRICQRKGAGLER